MVAAAKQPNPFHQIIPRKHCGPLCFLGSQKEKLVPIMCHYNAYRQITFHFGFHQPWMDSHRLGFHQPEWIPTSKLRGGNWQCHWWECFCLLLWHRGLSLGGGKHHGVLDSQRSIWQYWHPFGGCALSNWQLVDTAFSVDQNSVCIRSAKRFGVSTTFWLPLYEVSGHCTCTLSPGDNGGSELTKPGFDADIPIRLT